MYTLYYKPGSCSLAVHVLLNELGVPFEAVNATPILKSPEYLADINPRGEVPVLMINGKPMREGGAILSWLSMQHETPLMPRDNAERTKALEWLAWCNATLHPAYGRVFWVMRNFGDNEMKPQLDAVALKNIQALWDEAEKRLTQSRYLAGDQMTVADILLTVIANWKGYLPGTVTYGEKTQKLIAEVSQRPAFQRALQAEQVEYKAAA